MRKVSLFFGVLFLNIIKKNNPFIEDLICFFYKSLIIWTLNFRNNTINNSKSPKKMNNFFVIYYLYSILNHLKFNMIDIYMIFHHMLVLNFLIRDKYPSNQINFIHGNLILADYLNVISPIYCDMMNISGKDRNKFRNFSDLFFILYKSVFIPYMYILIDKKKWGDSDIFLNITSCAMYSAMYFKMNKIYELNKNIEIYYFNKILIFSSFLFSVYNCNKNKLLLSNNINKIDFDVFSKFTTINKVIYYYKYLILTDIIKNRESNSSHFKNKLLSNSDSDLSYKKNLFSDNFIYNIIY